MDHVTQTIWSGLQYTKAIVPNLLTEILVRLFLVLAVYVLHFNIQPHMQYISQEELLNDYKRPRRDSYIPAWATVCFIFLLPLIFLLVPWLLTRNYVDTTHALLAWTLALTINGFVTESIKLIVGRPRPDYFYRCFPSGKISEGFHCTGTLQDMLEGRKSFPSGHSSFSFCSLGFLSLWLCGRLKVMARNQGQRLHVVYCALPLVLATTIAVSRVCDNHHHWGDIFFGSFIGFFTSYVCYGWYYNPLDSDISGLPYILTECRSRDDHSMAECSSKEYVLRLRNINIREQ